MTDRPLIIGHRGASVEAPENTLSAFRRAIDAGADGIELDVRLSADGIPVVIHDANLHRVGRRPERVAELTADELSRVDVGSWFNRKHSGLGDPEFVRECVPTLGEVLRMLVPTDPAVYIELKTDDAGHEPLVAAVCDVIRLSPLLPHIIVKGFNLSAISDVKNRLPHAATCALFAPHDVGVVIRKRHLIRLAREHAADQISVHRSLATKGLTRRAADAGLPVTVWTADSPKWIKRARKRGITALITNNPREMLAARAMV